MLQCLTIILRWRSVIQNVFLRSRLESLQQVFVHQSHVRIVFNALELIITVEILSGAESTADDAAGLTGDDAGGLLEWMKQWILKQRKILLVLELLLLVLISLVLGHPRLIKSCWIIKDQQVLVESESTELTPGLLIVELDLTGQYLSSTMLEFPSPLLLTLTYHWC